MMHRRQCRLGLLLVPVLSILQLVFSCQPAQALDIDESYFENFTGDYYLIRDDDGKSVLKVTETIVTVFPKNSTEHGIERTLPFTGLEDTADGKTLDITATRNGQPEDIASITSGVGTYTVRIGNPNITVSGVQTYVLSYTYRNVITTESHYQELYWNTNGTGWSKPILNLTARVHLSGVPLPEDDGRWGGVVRHSDDLRSFLTGERACYVGYSGSTNQSRCTITELTRDPFSNGLVFSTKSLSPYENLTFAIAFAPDTFADNDDAGYTLDTRLYTTNRLVVLVVIAAVLGLVLVVLGAIVWHKVGNKRKFYKDYFVKPEYTPPADFSVAEMAKNYLGRAPGNPQVATLLNLAVAHKIELIKTETVGLLGRKHPTWTIRIKADASEFSEQETIVLRILAGGQLMPEHGQEISLKTYTANSTLTQLAENFSKSIQLRLETTDLFEPTKKTLHKLSTKKHEVPIEVTHINTRHVMLLIVALVIWTIGWIVAIGANFSDEALPSYFVVLYAPLLAPLLALIVIFVVVYLCVIISKTSAFDKRTKKGLEYSRYLDGLKLYMTMAEADRIKMLQSVEGADTTHEGIVKLYEKLLPYALIFRIEKSWLAELSRYYEFSDVSAPTWYVGVGAFSASSFSHDITSVSSAAAHDISSSSGSSDSGGSSGGGFSGGGGGGGGGGTW